MKKSDFEPDSNKFSFEKLKNFISKYYVYGAVGLILIIVAVITVVSIPTSNDSPTESAKPTEIVDKQPEVTPTPSIVSTPKPSEKPAKTPDNNPSPTPASTPTWNDNNDNEDDKDVKKDITTDFRISLPFDKKSIITYYSNETPLYSETLNEWACHVGVDFACNEDTDVPCAANGIIKEITEDELYGFSVLCEHSDGYFTLYRGLKSVSVKTNELVAKGQALGKSMASLPFEAHMPSHIHFEVVKNNLSVNPMSFAE